MFCWMFENLGFLKSKFLIFTIGEHRKDGCLKISDFLGSKFSENLTHINCHKCYGLVVFQTIGKNVSKQILTVSLIEIYNGGRK